MRAGSCSAKYSTNRSNAAAPTSSSHNHPQSRGPSAADLAQLSKPGVGAIIVVGHDGSMYAASAGCAYDRNRFETATYTLARTEIIHQLRVQVPAAGIELRLFDPYLEHLTALALDKAQVIRYRALLGDAQRAPYTRLAVVAGHVAESVGSLLGARVRQPALR